MFTGLIETTGTIESLEKTGGVTRAKISGPRALVRRLHEGDSVAVSGVCLTALDIDIEAASFCADLAAETIARTSLSRLHPSSVVNLELPTPSGAPLGGHIVQGHVDDIGTVRSLQPVSAGQEASATDWLFQVAIPENCARYVVEKGSITVDGISLTVAHVDGNMVTIAIIPHTYSVTNLHTLGPGSPVNIEVDVMAKYAERLAVISSASKEKHFELTVEYLIANGY